MCLDPDDMDDALKYDVVLAPKSQCRLMRFVAWFLGDEFLTNWWTTYRVPFGRPVIAYPDTQADPEKCTSTLRHEMFHVRGLAHWWGPLWFALCVTVFPLPVLFSGRWWIERRAYLDEIKQGLTTIDEAVHLLWNSYGMAWPPALMRRWFSARCV